MNATLHAIQERPAQSRYSARNLAKPVNVYYRNPAAKTVYLTGDFNDWNSHSHPMRQRGDGWWFVEVPLTHGHHVYQFLVDGVPTLDPNASGTVQTETAARASVMSVS